MLNLKVPIGETLHLAERTAAGAVRELGSVTLEFYSAGRVQLSFELPTGVEVERGAARERRVRHARAARPPTKRVSARERAQQAAREAAGVFYCHQYENGKYVKSLSGTQVEVERLGFAWQRSSARERFRGYVISDQPQVAGGRREAGGGSPEDRGTEEGHEG